MRRVTALSAVLLLGACTGAATPTVDAGGASTTATPAATGPSTTASTAELGAALAAEASSEPAPPDQPVEVAAVLSGAAEFPGPGDEGSGTFTGTLIVEEVDGQVRGELCYQLQVQGLSVPAAAAHVHRGAVDDAGEVVVPLQAPTGGAVEACVTTKPADVARIAAHPSRYYVNVHSDAYPDGAVRGQLSRPG